MGLILCILVIQDFSIACSLFYCTADSDVTMIHHLPLYATEIHDFKLFNAVSGSNSNPCILSYGYRSPSIWLVVNTPNISLFFFFKTSIETVLNDKACSSPSEHKLRQLIHLIFLLIVSMASSAATIFSDLATEGHMLTHILPKTFIPNPSLLSATHICHH